VTNTTTATTSTTTTTSSTTATFDGNSDIVDTKNDDNDDDTTISSTSYATIGGGFDCYRSIQGTLQRLQDLIVACGMTPTHQGMCNCLQGNLARREIVGQGGIAKLYSLL
jgi:hypothetical protein